MNFRVGACALLVCLAGCSAEAPDARMGAQTGKAATQLAGQKLRTVQMDRSAAQSIANAPDRGKLIEYKNKGAAIKREGAYTWYPVAISEAHALKAVVTGEMTIQSPDGTQVKLKYERHEEQADGNWTWIGRVVGGDQNQEAILTFGEKAVYGSIPQSSGAPLSLQTRSGALYAVQTDLSKVKNPNTAATDMMVPPAMALRQTLMASASKAQVSQAADVSTKASTPATTIDVAIGYTQGFASMPGGQSAAVTRLVFLVAVGNEAYQNSVITGALRLVNAVQVNYADNTTNQAALEDLTGIRNSAQIPVPAGLAPLRTAREQYGADVAVLVRKFQTPENDGCGIAWLNGAGQTAIDPAVDDDYAFAVVSDGDDKGTDGNTYFCAPETLVHELGHVMGSAHDQENSKTSTGALLYGRYPYSFGLKTTEANGNFYTIMAYGANNQNFYRTFSNPSVLKCGPAGSNLPCGVANQADNARSLNQTIPVVASFRISIAANSERIVNQDKYGMNNDNRADLFWRNSNSSSVAYWLMNGTTVTATRTVEPLVPNAYRQVGRGSLNGDALVDIVWTSAGRDLWLWSGTGTSFNAQFIATYPEGWEPITLLDMNGDGRSDIIFRNQATKKIAVWIMNGTVATSVYNVFAEVPANYSLAGTGDFNGDGRGDILWTSSALDLWMWSSNGSDFVPTFVANYPSTWRPAGTGDVTGDGRTDILWRNPSTSQVAYWVMSGATVTTTRNVSPLVPSNYWLASIGDYNGDGRADMIWTSTGRDLWAWTGNGTDYAASFLDYYPVGWAPEPNGS